MSLVEEAKLKRASRGRGFKRPSDPGARKRTVGGGLSSPSFQPSPKVCGFYYRDIIINTASSFRRNELSLKDHKF